MIGLALAAWGKSAQAPQAFEVPLILCQAPHRAPAKGGAFAYRLPPIEGGRIVLLDRSGAVTLLTSEFVSSSDPSLSYDGKKVLFTGKRERHEPWNVWEMDIDGTNKRQLTSGFGNCIQPRYLAKSAITPPEFEDKVRWIAFVSDGAAQLDERGDGLSTALYAQSLEPIQSRGIVRRRCTFNLSSDFSPTVISDGRIVFTSHQPGVGGGPARGVYPLFVSNWDGTVVSIFVGGFEGGILKTMACETPDRRVVFVESAGETADGSGQLAAISFKRPLHSHEVLSKGIGLYRAPLALPDGRLLVSYTNGRDSRGIYQFDFASGGAGRRIHSDPKWDDMQAVAVVERPEPQGLLSAVVDSEKTADLQCMNVYDSDLPNAAAIKKGEVKSVRFIEGEPLPVSEGSGEGRGVAVRSSRRILGEVPVEPDGSFYVRLPADTPFQVQTLDESGMVLQSQRGWIWVRRGTSRGCIGCHENKELAPENRATQALIKIQPHSLLVPAEERRPPADFVTSVRPILQSRCASCHSGGHASGGLVLGAGTASEWTRIFQRLLEVRPAGGGASGAYVVPENARKSGLLRPLLGVSVNAGTDGVHPVTTIEERERRTLIEWIDLGAPLEN